MFKIQFTARGGQEKMKSNEPEDKIPLPKNLYWWYNFVKILFLKTRSQDSITFLKNFRFHYGPHICGETDRQRERGRKKDRDREKENE